MTVTGVAVPSRKIRRENEDIACTTSVIQFAAWVRRCFMARAFEAHRVHQQSLVVAEYLDVMCRHDCYNIIIFSSFLCHGFHPVPIPASVPICEISKPSAALPTLRYDEGAHREA